MEPAWQVPPYFLPRNPPKYALSAKIPRQNRPDMPPNPPVAA
jgi:hypothetical protein